jgi:hypothetical protein
MDGGGISIVFSPADIKSLSGKSVDFEWLSNAHRGSKEAHSWEPWLKDVAKSRRAFADFIQHYDPMSNETASCGVLSAAASTAGLLSMTEFLCMKKNVHHYGKRVNGRADLWVADPGRKISWAFEAKQTRCVPGSRLETLRTAMALACHEASRMTNLDADRFFGLLIATLPPTADSDQLKGLRERLVSFAAEADFACEVGGGRHPAFLFFRGPKRIKASKT